MNCPCGCGYEVPAYPAPSLTHSVSSHFSDEAIQKVNFADPEGVSEGRRIMAAKYKAKCDKLACENAKLSNLNDTYRRKLASAESTFRAVNTENAELRRQTQLLENRVANYESEDNTIIVTHRRLESENRNLHKVNDDLRAQLAGIALRFDVAGKQVENLIEDNKVLRSAIATVGSIVKVAEQL
jgi:chromosome segregation ATPase